MSDTRNEPHCRACGELLWPDGSNYCEACIEQILDEDDAAIEAAYAEGAERDATDDPRDYNPESDPKKYDQGGDQ